jgi:NADH:ubiquinone oxidoreductase subunit E
LTFSLERVACFGSCALSPVMVVDKDVYGRLTTKRVRDILSKFNSD